jgi:hypothetical protein
VDSISRPRNNPLSEYQQWFDHDDRRRILINLCYRGKSGTASLAIGLSSPVHKVLIDVVDTLGETMATSSLRFDCSLLMRYATARHNHPW